MKYFFKLITIFSISLIILSYIIEFYYPQLKSNREDFAFWLDKFNHPECNIIITGDSRVYQSLNPRLFEAKMGKPTLNFAFSSNSYTQKYLDYIANTFDKADTIILGLSGQSLTYYASSENFERFLSYKEDSPKRWLKKLDLFLPKFQLNDFISTGKLLSSTPSKKITYVSKGQMAIDPIRSISKDGAINAYKKHYSDFPISKELVINIKSFIHKMRKKGRDVFFFNPPTSQEVTLIDSKHFDFMSLKKELEMIGAYYIDLKQRSTIETYDGDHVIGKKSKSFTSYFISRFKKSIPSQ